MILVTGAHGQLGSKILTQLRQPTQQRTTVIGGSRTPAAGIRHMDFDRPDSINLAGVSTLMLVSAGYAEDDQVIQRHATAIDAARRDGVRHIIYTSLTSAGDHLGFALAHRATENLIRESGLGWTFLRNGLYAELFGDLLTWTDERTVESAFGTGALAAVGRDDLAEVAAEVAAVVATSPATHHHRVYDLVGPPITAGQVAQRIGATHTPISGGEYRDRLLKSDGLLPFQPPMLTSIASSIRHGFLDSVTPDLEKLLGRPPADAVSIAAHAATRKRPTQR